LIFGCLAQAFPHEDLQYTTLARFAKQIRSHAGKLPGNFADLSKTITTPRRQWGQIVIFAISIPD